MIEIMVNGEAQSAPEGQTILGLLRQSAVPANISGYAAVLAYSLHRPFTSPLQN